MEDIRSTLDNLLNVMENFESEWDKKLKESYQEIQKICSQPKSKPINKRLKRLQTVADVELEIENEDNLESSVKSRDNRNSADSESVCETSQQTERPKRAAKLKILDNLKEKPLRGKLRQPSILSDLSSVNNITVKKEKLSKLPDDDNNDRQQQKQNDQLSKKEQQKDIEKRKSDENDDANKENSKKIDDNSLEIVGANDNVAVIELSDNEDVGKMPPPTILPPKKRIGRNRKNDKSTSDSTSISASKTSDTTTIVSSKTIKAEKSSLDNKRRTSATSSTLKDVEIRLEKIKTEKYSSSSNESKKSTEKSKKGKKVVKPKIIKEENTEDKNESEKRNQNKSSSSSLSTNSKKNSETERNNNNDNRNSEESSELFRRTTRNASKKKATSGDSVYEDALTDQINNNCDEKQIADDNDNVNPNDSNESNKSDVIVRIKKLKIPIDSKDKTSNDDQMVVADKEIVKATIKTKTTPLPLPRKTPPFVEPSPDKVIDVTFVSAVSENGEADDVPITDATFVTDTAQQTFVVDKEKPQIIQTVDVQIKSKTINTVGNAATTPSPVNPENCNATFSVDVNVADSKALPKNKNHNKDNDEMSENSLITEDDSHAEGGHESDDSPLLKLIAKGKPKLKPKHKNELFSPFIQSPVKKKVAAFEKHANEAAAASPVPQRQTRTKTRLKQLQQQNEQGKESEETAKQHQSQHIPEFNHHNQNQKNRTPILPSRLARILTPTQQSNVTPTLTNPLKKVLPSSTSKLQSLQKAFSSTSLASSKGSSLSQESCHNIEKSQSKSKLNNLLEEKKKIREMKIQQVLKTKEHRDKEREDRLKKNLEMKYEKTRKAELEKRKELQKNLKLYEEAQRKLEKQKLLEFEKTEAIRRDKELQEKINLAQEQMKMKLYQQQLLHQQQQAQQRLMQQQQQQQKQQQKAHVKPIDKCRYDFDILNSDDSTDDEEKTSSKRPQPPIWSKSSVRQFHIERQAHLPPKIIDSFFSVQPMTPNLQEIFPTIDPRYLKRNSSVVWKTPPRYSELPKY